MQGDGNGRERKRVQIIIVDDIEICSCLVEVNQSGAFEKARLVSHAVGPPYAIVSIGG